jgi:hypothetical protein
LPLLVSRRGQQNGRTSRKTIGGPANLERKGGRRPKLTHDKGSTGHADKESNENELTTRVDKAHASRGNGRQAQDGSHGFAGPILVTQWTEKESNKNGSDNTGHGRCPYIFLGDGERVLNISQEWRDAKPHKKADKDGKPSSVEDAHVRFRKRTELYLLRLVVLIMIDDQVIGAVLFPSKKRK